MARTHSAAAPVNLAAIRARAEAATSGPWDWNVGEEGYEITPTGEHNFTAPFSYDSPHPGFVPNGVPDEDAQRAQVLRDEEFLAHAREDVPALCDTITRMQAALERERTASAEWIDRIRSEIRRSRGSVDRGCYAWDDDRYRAEFSQALDRLEAAIAKASKDTHATDLTDCPTTAAEVSAARSGAIHGIAADAWWSAVYERIAFLSEYGYHRKKDVRLRDLSFAQIINHLHGEAAELYDDLSDDKPGALYELADVLCIALHVAVRKGWTLGALASGMMEKLDARFDVITEEQPTR